MPTTISPQSPTVPTDPGTLTVPADGGALGHAWTWINGPTTLTLTAVAAALIGFTIAWLILRKPAKTDAGKRLMYVPLLLVNGAAIYGQVAFFYENVAPSTWPEPGKLALAALIAAAIESISVYVGWHAHDALINKAGKSAAQLRRASYFIAAVVAGINYAHFADFTPTNKIGLNAAAAAFGLLSLISPWLWGLHSRRLKNIRLHSEGVIDAAGATFSSERTRSFPLRAYLAHRWSIDNYVTDPKHAWEGYNKALQQRWATTVDNPGWWMRVNPVTRVRQLLVALEQQQKLTADKAHENADLTAQLANVESTLVATRNEIYTVTADRDMVSASRDALNGELAAARNEIAKLNEQLTAAGFNAATVKAEHALTVERLEADNTSLRDALTAQAEKFTAERNETVRQLKDKHAEKLNQVRAEAATVDINAYRRKATEKATAAVPNRAAMSDEDAVQAMYDEHNDPAHEWSKNAVRKLTGAGWDRIPRLLNAWHEKALNEGGGEAAVNQ